MNKSHKLEIDVYYEDTDCGGVVYYANYLKYFERGRTELLRSCGVNPAAWMKRGITFAVARAEIVYKAPAIYGDRLIIETFSKPGRGARLFFEYIIRRKEDNLTLVTGKTDMACIGPEMRPKKIPDEILEKIS